MRDAFGRRAGDQPEVLASDTIRHDEAAARADAPWPVGRSGPASAVAAVEHDIDALAFEQRDEIGEFGLARLHLLEQRSFHAELLEPPARLLRQFPAPYA